MRLPARPRAVHVVGSYRPRSMPRPASPTRPTAARSPASPRRPLRLLLRLPPPSPLLRPLRRSLQPLLPRRLLLLLRRRPQRRRLPLRVRLQKPTEITAAAAALTTGCAKIEGRLSSGMRPLMRYGFREADGIRRQFVFADRRLVGPASTACPSAIVQRSDRTRERVERREPWRHHVGANGKQQRGDRLLRLEHDLRGGVATIRAVSRKLLLRCACGG